MKHFILVVLAACGASNAHAQTLATTGSPLCDPAGHGVQVTKLHSDSLASSFVICIHDSVPPHLHRYHTEHVTVLNGTGVMLLGDSTFTIAPGDVIVIPRNTPHAARSTGSQALRVLSVQAPFFDGTDRVPVQR
jgi:mannose-6-phosphate isomerase-like protein (cupin superfamily)